MNALRDRSFLPFAVSLRSSAFSAPRISLVCRVLSCHRPGSECHYPCDLDRSVNLFQPWLSYLPMEIQGCLPDHLLTVNGRPRRGLDARRPPVWAVPGAYPWGRGAERSL